MICEKQKAEDVKVFFFDEISKFQMVKKRERQGLW